MSDLDQPIEPVIFAALKGEAGPAEAEALRAWRAASPDNERRYRETVQLWEAMGGAHRETVRPPPTAAELVRTTGVRQSPPAPLGRPVLGWLRWPLVAAAALALAAVSWEIGRKSGGSPSMPPFGADEFVTGVGETATVSLRDGSVVRLAPSSRLTVAPVPGAREVSFRGRAYFAVASDSTRPFRVRTPAGEVTVLGTRFDVQTEGENLRLLVVEGRVSVSARGRETVVRPGEMGRVLDGVTVPPVKVPDAEAALDWVGNFFAFQSTPLPEVVSEIRRRYGVRIEIADSSLAGRSVSGWFAESSHEAMLRVICAAVLANCTTRQGVVVMTSM